MSSNNDISPILVEYMNLLRELMLHHNNLITSYSRTTETLASQLSRLILNTNLNSNSNNNLNNTFTQQDNFFDNPSRHQNRNTTLIWPPSFRNTHTNTFTTPRRTNTRINTAPQRRRERYNFSWSNPIRTRRRNYRRRDLVEQILNNSLYTSTTRNPASNADISYNTSIYNWEDISSTTDQTICPITQESFTSGDRVMRINNCGHLFIYDALTTYFTEFDHRCPVCRYSIRRNIPSPTPSPLTTSTQTTNTTDISNNFSFPGISRNESFWGDISYNFVNSTDTNTNTDLAWADSNFSFNDAINHLSNAMANQITTAINNPDNSGNMIAAEYSLFIPQVFNADNTTNN